MFGSKDHIKQCHHGIRKYSVNVSLLILYLIVIIERLCLKRLFCEILNIYIYNWSVGSSLWPSRASRQMGCLDLVPLSRQTPDQQLRSTVPTKQMEEYLKLIIAKFVSASFWEVDGTWSSLGRCCVLHFDEPTLKDEET